MWVDSGNLVLRRGLVAILGDAGFEVVGESTRFDRLPGPGAVDWFVFEWCSGDLGRNLNPLRGAGPSTLPGGPQTEDEALTATDVQLLEAIARRETNAEIAQALHLSERSVKRRLHKLYARLQLAGRMDAAVYASAVLGHGAGGLPGPFARAGSPGGAGSGPEPEPVTAATGPRA